MSMTAALVMTSCSSDDVQDWPTPTTKTIPYTVTVSQGTRATVDGDLSTLRFAEGDKLSISGTNISGMLDMTSGEGETQATFSGNLTYTGAGDPADNLYLTATLVSAQQSGTEVTYPTDAYCATVDEAVQKYSRLTGTGTYGAKAFALSQGTAFLNFKITFDYGASADEEISAAVTNNNIVICSANVKTTETEDHKVVAKFVLPIAGDTKLNNAMVMMDTKGAFIADATLAAKVYNVNKTIGAFTINASGDKVLFAPGNLQATYNGSTWTWAFAEHQWDYIGGVGETIGSNEITGNNLLTTTEPFINGTGTVDLFGWVGASCDWDGVNKFGIYSLVGTSYHNNDIIDSYGTVAGEAMKAEWNSDNLTITNGGTYKWRTLTSDEWEYVLQTRKVTVGSESKPSYGLGRVNGEKGVIILPDGWDGSVHGGFTYGNPNGYFNNNKYTTTSTPTWSQMEAAGCVFLPAAGVRVEASVNYDGYDASARGYYRSSTADPSDFAYAFAMFFSQNDFYATTSLNRASGMSVRLVRPAE